MNHIDRHNYEAFFLDYLEGQLSVADSALLQIFLEQNADLKAELIEMELIHLSADETIGLDKSVLEKKIDVSNVEEYIISSIEQTIDSDDAKDLHTYLKTDVAAQKLEQRYQQTLLKPAIVVFPAKSQLKKNVLSLEIIVSLASIAAAVAIVFLYILPNQSITSSPNLSSNKPQTSVIDSSDYIRFLTDELVVGGAVVKSSIDTISNNVVQKKQQQTIVVEREVVDVQKENNLMLASHHTTEIDTSSSLHNATVSNAMSEHVVYSTHYIAETELASGSSSDSMPSATMHELFLTESPEPKSISPSVEALTVREWARKQFRESVLKTEAPSDKKLDGTELLMAVASNIDDDSRTQFDYSVSEKSTSYRIAIGRFEFSRTKSH